MNHVKNLVKILLLAQCLLLCCVCGNKETAILEPTEQQRLNLANFVKCPFKEEFKNNTNLEKYVLKKFGKPDNFGKVKSGFGDAGNEDIFGYEIWLNYTEKNPGARFTIFRGISVNGVSKKFEIFKYLSIYNLTDLIDFKYGINIKTTTRDIENLFGKSGNLEKKYYDSDNEDSPYYYFLTFGFEEGKLNSLYIETRIRDWKL